MDNLPELACAGGDGAYRLPMAVMQQPANCLLLRRMSLGLCARRGLVAAAALLYAEAGAPVAHDQQDPQMER